MAFLKKLSDSSEKSTDWLVYWFLCQIRQRIAMDKSYKKNYHKSPLWRHGNFCTPGKKIISAILMSKSLKAVDLLFYINKLITTEQFSKGQVASLSSAGCDLDNVWSVTDGRALCNLLQWIRCDCQCDFRIGVQDGIFAAWQVELMEVTALS